MKVSVAPPLAGLGTYAQGAETGVTVDVTVMRLRRYVFLKSQLLHVFAGHFNHVPEWEVKGAFSLHMWQDAEHSTALRKRITEMRTPPHHLDRSPDPALDSFMAELRSTRHTDELLVAIYEVLKPAMAEAFRTHLEQTHLIADHPTRRLLKFFLQEEEEQLAWGRQAIAALLSADAPTAERIENWRSHLQVYLAAAGGILGENPSAQPLPPSRVNPASPLPSQQPRRDERFTRVWRSRGLLPGANASVHERIWWMMNVRLNEMHVSELIASVLAEWKDQPWDFYHDLSRHLWDETRHCMLGEIAFASQGIDFTKIPTHIGFAEYPNLQLEPADRYSFLWGIEQGLMGKSGKQAEMALAQEGLDERATVFQDYDWADEVLHAQIGRRWLEPHYGSREKMNEAYTRVRPAYDEGKDEDLKKPGRDWWNAFYQAYLASKDPHPSTSLESTVSSASEAGY